MAKNAKFVMFLVNWKLWQKCQICHVLRLTKKCGQESQIFHVLRFKQKCDQESQICHVLILKQKCGQESQICHTCSTYLSTHILSLTQKRGKKRSKNNELCHVQKKCCTKPREFWNFPSLHWLDVTAIFHNKLLNEG